MKYDEWLYRNLSNLESDFIEQTPADEQPLDDDIPDFMKNKSKEFNEFCINRFNDLEEQENGRMEFKLS